MSYDVARDSDMTTPISLWCTRLMVYVMNIHNSHILCVSSCQLIMKKALRETQTLHAGCSKVEPKNLAPPQTPFPGVWNGQNLISWRWSLPLPINPVW